MANLLEVQGTVIPIGTIIQAVGPPDSSWVKCDGSILLKADYQGYVINCEDLHPLMWKNWYFVDVDQSTTGTTKYAISRMNSNIIACVGAGNTVWVSDDGGVTWSTNTGLTANTHYVLTNNNTVFVTADYNTSTAYHSTDGITWTSASLPFSGLWRYASYCSSAGKFILMTNSHTYSYAYSSDGSTWNTGTAPFYHERVRFLTNDGSKFIVFSYYQSDPYEYLVHTSTDGINWSSGTVDFLFGSPSFNYLTPTGMFYLNGEYYMPYLYSNNDNWCLKYVGSDIKDPDDWVRFLIQPSGNADYFNCTNMIYTGNHIIGINSSTSEDGLLVGKTMTNLNFYRTQFYGMIGIVNDGENYAVILPTTNGWHSVVRSTGVNYDTSTHFQLPLLGIVNDYSRVYHYIKISE